jgi:hypothetical protein
MLRNVGMPNSEHVDHGPISWMQCAEENKDQDLAPLQANSVASPISFP